MLSQFSIQSKLLVLITVLGLCIYLLMDFIQSRYLDELLIKEVVEESQYQAKEDHALFDLHVRKVHLLAQMISHHANLQKHLSSQDWLERGTSTVVQHTRKPSWLPPSSLLRAFSAAVLPCCMPRMVNRRKPIIFTEKWISVPYRTNYCLPASFYRNCPITSPT